METYENVFQYPFSVIDNVPFEMRGHWREQYFHNDHPIVLELGCGKGEYTVELAKLYPDVNFIGVDIKGARMWTGATQALKEGLKNVAFLRTNIEIIERFFAEDEVQEIWLTFSDPQMKNPRKRLTSTYFMERYRKFLVDGGIIHLKTDSNFLFTYTTYMVEHNALPVLFRTEDLYGDHQCSARPKDACYQRDARMVYVQCRTPLHPALLRVDVDSPWPEHQVYEVAIAQKRSPRGTRRGNRTRRLPFLSPYKEELTQ